MKSPLAAAEILCGIFRGCLLLNNRRAEYRLYIVFSMNLHADTFLYIKKFKEKFYPVFIEKGVKYFAFIRVCNGKKLYYLNFFKKYHSNILTSSFFRVKIYV